MYILISKKKIIPTVFSYLEYYIACGSNNTIPMSIISNKMCVIIPL